jgi:plastocyanin
LVSLAMVATAFAACAGPSGDTRTVLVDYQSDEFAGTFRGYFPRDITVNPGMTVKFHQTWSGEPHSVTTGTEVQRRIEPLMSAIEQAYPREPGDDEAQAAGITEDQIALLDDLPFIFGEKGVNQAAAQPCVMRKGLPKGAGRCKDRDLQPFTGRESYYSSGFIPYLGATGNNFEMKIADDAKAGSYIYYCDLHGAAMSGRVIVKDGDVPSQAEVNRQARREAKQIEAPLLAQLRKERAGNGDFTGNLAGSGTDATFAIRGQVNEFTPRTVQARVGEPVTWTFVLNHSISFNVPKYVPWYAVQKDGTVTEDESVYRPAGGWPSRTPELNEEGGPSVDSTEPNVTIDAGDFDGSGGLKSSGVAWQSGDKYVVTFTKAGTYPMACLVHPGMIGKVVVS